MKNFRIYIATQQDCQACELTKEALGFFSSPDSKETPTLANVPMFEINLTGEQMKQRKMEMGVTATPTVSIVGGEDDDKDSIWEQDEEKILYHQSGIILDKAHLVGIVNRIKEGKIIRTRI